MLGGLIGGTPIDSSPTGQRSQVRWEYTNTLIDAPEMMSKVPINLYSQGKTLEAKAGGFCGLRPGLL